MSLELGCRVLRSTSYHLQTLQHRQEDGVTAATCELSESTARLGRGSPCVLASASLSSSARPPFPVESGSPSSLTPGKESPFLSEEAVICGIPGSEQGAGLWERWRDRRASVCLS